MFRSTITKQILTGIILAIVISGLSMTAYILYQDGNKLDNLVENEDNQNSEVTRYNWDFLNTSQLEDEIISRSDRLVYFDLDIDIILNSDIVKGDCSYTLENGTTYDLCHEIYYISGNEGRYHGLNMRTEYNGPSNDPITEPYNLRYKILNNYSSIDTYSTELAIEDVNQFVIDINDEVDTIENISQIDHDIYNSEERIRYFQNGSIELFYWMVFTDGSSIRVNAIDSPNHEKQLIGITYQQAAKFEANLGTEGLSFAIYDWIDEETQYFIGEQLQFMPAYFSAVSQLLDSIHAG